MLAYEMNVEYEDIPIRGNIIVSDDPSYDRKIENDIIAEIERGNVWAWCCIIVTCTLTVEGQTFTGYDTLGCCSYKNEEEFRSDCYYDDMCNGAKRDLLDNMREDVLRGEIAAKFRNRIE